MLSTLLTTTGLLALAAASPLQARASSNCTTYTSTDTGVTCTQQPSDCTAWYSPAQGENCISVAQKFHNFSLPIFYYWHPDVGSACTNLLLEVPYCINTPWYTYEGAIEPAEGTIKTVSATPEIDAPFPIPYNTTANCDKYEQSGPNTGAYKMSQDNGISLDQFYAWNPSVTPTTYTLQYYWYCVGVSS